MDSNTLSGLTLTKTKVLETTNIPQIIKGIPNAPETMANNPKTAINCKKPKFDKKASETPKTAIETFMLGAKRRQIVGPRRDMCVH